MSEYSSLKATINANVKANNNQEITGAIMNSVLNAMVNSLGAGYQYIGMATPTNPGSAQTPDYKCFYLATTPGTYTNLGGLVVADGEVAILKYDTSWTKEVSGIASADKLNQLGQKVDGVPEVVFDLSTLELNGGIINNAGVYYNVNPYNVNYRYKLLSLSSYISRTLKIITQEDRNAEIAFLAGELVNGETAPFCSETTLIEQGRNTSADYIIPNDCVSLYIFYKDTRTDYNQQPESITALAINSSFYTKDETDSLFGNLKYQVLREPSKLGQRSVRVISSPVIKGTYYPLDETVILSPKINKDRNRMIPVMVSGTAKYWYTGTVPNANNVSGVVYMDNEGNVVGTELPSASTAIAYTNYLLTVPDNAVFICANSSSDTFSIKIEDYADNFVDTDELYNVLPVNKTEIPCTLTSGYRVETDGNIVISSAGSVSQVITIDRSKKYYLKTRIDQYRTGVGFYNSLTTQDDTTCVGIYFTSNAEDDVEGYIPIPDEAIVMVICTLSSLELSSVNLSQLTKCVEYYQGSENIGKVLMVGDDGNVHPEETPTPVSIGNCVRTKQDRTLYLGNNILSGVTGSGTGWSENNGVYTHSTGNVSPLEFSVNTESGESYVAILKTGIGNFAENAVNVSIGSGQMCDIYYGTTGPFIIGIVSDGGTLKITPSSSYNSTVYDIELRKIVDEEDAVITLQQTNSNVEANTMIGNITSWWNVAIGDEGTLQNAQNASRNIAIGHNAQNALESGERNIAIGTFSMNALKHGLRNIAIGADCLWTAKTAVDNVAIGKVSMGKTGSPVYNRNVAIGTETLESSGTIEDNVAIGHNAMAQLDTDNAYKNVCIGAEAGYYALNKNVYIGYRSGRYNQADNNVFLGAETGLQGVVTNISNSIVVGYQAKVGTANGATFSNSIAIGYQATATKSNQVVIGNSSTDEIVLGNKKIVFNNDNTVSWETVS